jgi:hypothetical protein
VAGDGAETSFCPLIMPAGRPTKADPGALYAFAHQFYWDLRRVSEGHFRWKHDEEEYRRLADLIDRQKIQLSDGQNVAIARVVVKEVQDGRLTEAEKEGRLRDAASSNREAERFGLYREAAESSRKQLMIPGKPDVIQALLQAETPEEVVAICKDAFVLTTIPTEPGLAKQVMVPNWPIPAGSVLPSNLSRYAAEFIAATRDPRFPRSTNRPSSRLKQLWFLSRALAGALYGVRTRTAINLVGSKRPEEIFDESGDCKPRRQRTDRRGRRS